MIGPGVTFGLLTAISPIGSGKFWICRCQCGQETRASKWHLEHGRRKSCGCRLKLKDEQIQCLNCYLVKPRSDFYLRPDDTLFSATCKACTKVRVKMAGRLKSREDKVNAILKYGGCCECCGEKLYEFLQIDHEGGGGAEHRKELKTKSIYRVLRQKGYPSHIEIGGKNIRIRVLCANCNIAIGLYGYCPHKVAPAVKTITIGFDKDSPRPPQEVTDFMLRSEATRPLHPDHTGEWL